MARPEKIRREASDSSRERDLENRDNRRKSNYDKPKRTDLPSGHHEVPDGNPGDEREPMKPPQPGERKFDILVDSVPYMVKAAPFTFNGETRYRVSFNGSPEHVFTWDSSLGQLRAIDDDSSTMPDSLEEAISERLQSE